LRYWGDLVPHDQGHEPFSILLRTGDKG
jgi:hypothetical protein